MTAKALLLLHCTALTGVSLGQQLTPFDALRFGGINAELITAIAVDNDGNLHLGGRFKGTMDADPGAGVNSLTSAGLYDGFLIELNADGDFISASRFGSTSDDSVNKLVIDASGNVLITGYITGVVDMDPGPGTLSITSGAFDDMFLCKYGPDGAALWAIASQSTNGNAGYALDVDEAGNSYVGGVFYGTMDLDGNGAMDVHVSAGSGDAFLCSYDANGTYRWSRSMGGPLRDEVTAVKAGPSGQLFVGGLFRGIADLSPQGTLVFTSNGDADIFEGRFTSEGALTWMKATGGTGLDAVLGMDLTENGDLLTTGGFTGEMDMDPDLPILDLVAPSATTQAGFVRSSASGTGGLQWAKALSSSAGAAGWALRCTTDGGAIICGSFLGTLDAEPGPAVLGRTSNGGSDGFLIVLSPTGEHLLSTSFGSNLDESCLTVGKTANGDILCAGNFRGTMELNGSSAPLPLVSNGDSDAYLLFLNETEIVSVNERDEALVLNVFPNPANTVLNVVTDKSAPVGYEIIDAIGRNVLTGILAGGTQPLNIGDLGPGTYCLKIADNTQRFVVQ